MNCYAVLGVIHSALAARCPGRFKDYIAIPKSNLYQSLHTTVVGPKGEHVEFQIRTEEMHRIAEYGIAAHWKYKEQGHLTDRDSKAFGWLQQFIEWQEDLTDNRQFMDSVKLDLFHDVVVCVHSQRDGERVAERVDTGRFCVRDSHSRSGTIVSEPRWTGRSCHSSIN